MDDKRRVKISYVISSSEIGGTERMLILMALNLPSERFYPPVVFAIKGQGKFTSELQKKGIRSYILNIKSNPFDFIKFLILLHKERPEILHSFLFYGNLVARIAGKLLQIPVLISSQRSTDLWRKKYHWAIDRFTARWTDMIISNSFAGKDVLMQKALIDEEKIRVIHNGIDVTSSGPTAQRNNFGIKPSEYVVGTVGNLREPKGHAYLISAAPIILKRFPDTKFLIVGEGKLKERLIKEASEAGVADRFIFTGFIKDVAEIIRIFDVFAFPSLWEGCPVGILEAMKERRASIAFPAGDIPFIIENGKSGLIVPSKSYKELAYGIISLLENEELRTKLGENAGKRIRENFSDKAMMQKYIRAYLETVDLNVGKR